MQNQPQHADLDAAQITPSNKNRNGFFQVGLHTLKLIHTLGGGHNEIMAYMVLCGGVDGRRTPRIKTYGAKSVKNRTGLSRSQIYRLMELNEFPHSARLSPAVSGWDEGEVDQWLNHKFIERDEVRNAG